MIATVSLPEERFPSLTLRGSIKMIMRLSTVAIATVVDIGAIAVRCSCPRIESSAGAMERAAKSNVLLLLDILVDNQQRICCSGLRHPIAMQIPITSPESMDLNPSIFSATNGKEVTVHLTISLLRYIDWASATNHQSTSSRSYLVTSLQLHTPFPIFINASRLICPLANC